MEVLLHVLRMHGGVTVQAFVAAVTSQNQEERSQLWKGMMCRLHLGMTLLSLKVLVCNCGEQSLLERKRSAVENALMGARMRMTKTATATATATWSWAMPTVANMLTTSDDPDSDSNGGGDVVMGNADSG